MNLLKRFARYILRNDLQLFKSTIQTLEADLSVSKTPNTEVVVEKVYGISKEVFEEKVVKKLESPIVSSNTSATQAAYLLGIQRALDIIESEVVHA